MLIETKYQDTDKSFMVTFTESGGHEIAKLYYCECCSKYLEVKNGVIVHENVDHAIWTMKRHKFLRIQNANQN